MPGMPTIMGLAFLLASGVILVIFSCAWDNNWLPLLVVLTYVLAPFPNMICKRLAGSSDDFFVDDSRKGILELGFFLTAIFVVSGFGLPLVLNHANIITDHSMILSLVGGLLIYLTILGYTKAFSEDRDD